MEVQETSWWGEVCGRCASKLLEVRFTTLCKVSNAAIWSRPPNMDLSLSQHQWTLLIETRVSSHLTWAILSWHGMLTAQALPCWRFPIRTQRGTLQPWVGDGFSHAQGHAVCRWLQVSQQVSKMPDLEPHPRRGPKEAPLSKFNFWNSLKISTATEMPKTFWHFWHILTLFFVLSHPHIATRLRMESKMSKLQLTPFPTHSPVLQLWSGSQVVKASKHIEPSWIQLSPCTQTAEMNWMYPYWIIPYLPYCPASPMDLCDFLSIC